MSNKEISIKVTQKTNEIDLSINSNRLNHNLLLDRNLPNQHSISAITGLSEELKELEENILLNKEAIESVEPSMWGTIQSKLEGE